MLIISAKMRCDHCERYQETDVILDINYLTKRLDLKFASEPPQGWRRDYTGYVVCVKCQEEFERAPI